jgi:DNA-binding PadR family transcriptional regulator
VNLTRLMALGTLARYGPTHGHQIRRLAEVSNAGEWSGVSVGGLYRELRLMEGEGLVQALRTEQVGRRPARTVYAITPDGTTELASLRVQAIRSLEWGPDAIGVALTFAFEVADREELRDLLRARQDRFAIGARELEATRQRGISAGYLTPVEAEVMRRGVLHAEVEVAWHDDFDKLLGGPAPGGASNGGPAPGGASNGGLAPGGAGGGGPTARGGDERARAAGGGQPGR